MKLTDTQRDVLLAAAEHTSGRIEIFPAHVKGGARANVLQGLVTRGLAKALKTGHCLTPAAYAALGLDAPAKEGAARTPKAKPANVADTAQPAAKPIREGTKQAQVIAMLQRKGGATVAQIQAETGWLPHTVRGILSAALRTKLGLDVTSAKTQGGERVYRIEASA